MTEPGLCPHCGAEAALAVGYPGHKVGREFVCKNCGANGGMGKTAVEAVEKWNRRITRDRKVSLRGDPL